MSTASLLTLPRAVFYNALGQPLAGGFVYTYVPGGTTPKTTWQDAGETTPNANPIVLDAAGSCLLYGSGSYQITVTDSLGNQVPAYSGLTSDALTETGISAAMVPVVGAPTTSAATSLLTYLASGGGAAPISVTQKLAQTVSVLDYGAVGDGSTDDTAAIMAAIASLPPAGGVVLFPPRQFVISSTLTLGNGSTGGVSSINGVILRGTAGVMAPFAAVLGIVAVNSGTQLIWKPSAAAGVMVEFSGPVMGCGIQNMLLNGSGVASVGLKLLSASFGDNENLSITGCISQSLLLDTNRSGTSINSMNNRFHSLFIQMSNAAPCQGILLDGDTTQNSCYNDFENVFINLPSTQQSSGILLRGCDSNNFRNVLVLGGSSAASSVLFDYTGVSNTFPAANNFFGIDPDGSNNVPSANQWINNGAPGSGAKPNHLYGLAQDNGASYPSTLNLSVDIPDREFFVANTGLTAGFTTASLYTPLIGGMFRINYNLMVTTTGTGGTITPTFNATGTGVTQTFSGTAVNTTASPTGTSQGSFIAWCDPNVAITNSVTFSAVTGSPVYALYISIERLD